MCWVIPQRILRNALCIEHQKPYNVEWLHYLKDPKFYESELKSLFSWIMWTRWKIRLMSWWHKIQGKPFLGEFKENLRRSLYKRYEIWGRFIVSYLIRLNPKLDDGEWATKGFNFLFIGMASQKQKNILILYL